MPFRPQISGLGPPERRTEILAARERELASIARDVLTDAVAVNTAAIAANASNIAANTTDIGLNTIDITDNTANIATNTADIAANTADIATNTAALVKLPEYVAGGLGSGTTNASASLQVAHGLSWTPDVAVVSPISPNGGSITNRWVGTGGVGVDDTYITVGRCISQNASLLASTAVTFFWIALKN